MKNRRANTNLVIAVIILAVSIAVGAIVFANAFTVLDGMRDSDFSAAANTTIAGVDTDFWAGMDLVRLLLIIAPAAAALGGLIYYLGARRT